MKPICAMRPTPASAPSRLTGLLGVLLILLTGSLAAPAHALTTISNDTTISTAINDSVQVTGSAQVNLVSGGSISGDLTTFNSSSVTLTGSGAVGGSVTLNDSSAVTLSASGGSIGGGVTVNQSSTLTVLGGTISSPVFDGVYVSGGTVNIFGGTISNPGHDGVLVAGGAANISGGTITNPGSNGVAVLGGAANISGGIISNPGNGGVHVQSGTVEISGGMISSPATYGVGVLGGTVSISAGIISNPGTYGVRVNKGTASIAGGTISSPASYGVGVLSGAATVHGCNLQLSGSSLTGTFPDGTPLNTTAYVETAPGRDGTPPGQLLLGNQEPQITGPANLSRPTDPGLCTATLNPGTATAISPCGLPVQVTGTRSDHQPLNAPYPVGTTTLTWTATDGSGPVSQGTQTITVTDTEKPSLTCPVNQTVSATSDAGTAVSYAVQNVTDNCPGVSLVCSPPSGSTFPLGTTTVTCTATDTSGNSSVCSFTITVVSNADLALTLAASPIPVKNKQSLTYTIQVTNAGPSAATNVMITNPLPPDCTFLSASAPGVTLSLPAVGSNGTLIGKVASLPASGSVTVALTVAVNTRKTLLSNTASVSSAATDPVPANNTATLAVPVK